MVNRVVLVGLIITGIATTLYSQDRVADRIRDALEQAYTFEQKLYIQTDNRSFYSAGEVIYFKAYLVDAIDHRRSTEDAVGYIEIANSNNEPIVNQKLKFENGTCSGNIAIPTGTGTGSFTLRAYTKLLAGGYYGSPFSMPLRIYQNSGIEEPDKLLEKQPSEVSIRFFPEGGYLVDSLESMVGVYASSGGKGVMCSGEIRNESDSVVALFGTDEWGYGVVPFTPKKNEKYAAYTNINNGVVGPFALPKHLSEGVVLKVIDDNGIQLRINRSKQLDESDATLPIYVAVQSRGVITYLRKHMLAPSGLNLSIPSDSMTTGLHQIVLFSREGIPILERLFFMGDGPRVNFTIVPDKEVYRPRDNVRLDITVNDEQGMPVRTDFALGITDLNYYETEGPLHLADTYLNIDSECLPNSYPIGGTDPNVVLLTRGWARFTWANLLEGKDVSSNYHHRRPYAQETGLEIRGKVVDKISRDPIPGTSITLTISGENPRYLFEITDSDGTFVFSDLDIYGTKTLYLTPRGLGQVERELDVVMEKSDEPQKIITNSQPLTLLADQGDKGRRLFMVKSTFDETIERITRPTTFVRTEDYRGRKKRKVTVSYHADNIVHLEDYIPFTSTEELIREIVPGVLVRKKKGRFKVRVLDYVSKMYFKREPLYLVDGVPVEDANVVIELHPDNIRMVTVSRPPAVYQDFGTVGEHGVVAFFTTGFERSLAENSEAKKIEFIGYSFAREYYTPEFGEDASPQVPDFRPLLYWNPNVQTDVNGKASVVLRMSDDVTSWRISAEAITADGSVGSGTGELRSAPIERQ